MTLWWIFFAIFIIAMLALGSWASSIAKPM